VKGWDAWSALQRASGGEPDRRRYIHDEWIPLYDAIAAGRIRAKGAASPGGEHKDISELFGGSTGLSIDPWHDRAEGSGYKFYDVRFWPSSTPPRKHTKKLSADEVYALYEKHAAEIRRRPTCEEDIDWRKVSPVTDRQMRTARARWHKDNSK